MSRAAAKVPAIPDNNEKQSIHDSKIRYPPMVQIPASGIDFSQAVKTPKTPADEGVDFFESSISHGEGPIRVYELQLDPDGGPNKDRAYIRLPPPYVPYILRVTLDAGTPASKNAVLKTNFPIYGGIFTRDKFVEKKLPTNFSQSIHINLPISHAGAFVYWLEYDGPTSERVIGREGYFNIDPILCVKSRSKVISAGAESLPSLSGGTILQDYVNLPLDGVVVLTVVSKWMGNLGEWKPHFQEASKRGYNMLHYTPLQQRGTSGSPYSIADQLRFDAELTGKTSAGNGFEKIRAILKVARDDYGLLSLTDVVLNHTSNDSLWLCEHPEAGYSPLNTPHLSPALELDNAIMDFSSTLASRGLPTRISSQSDIDALMNALASKVRDEIQLWQYYVLDPAREMSGVLTALAGEVPIWTGPHVKGKSVTELAHIVKAAGKINGLGQFSERYGVHSDPKDAASLVRAAFTELRDPQSLAEAWKRIVDAINVPLYEEWEDDTRVALDNVKNRVVYTRLADHGPKLGEITPKQPLVETYFTRLPLRKQMSQHDLKALSLANNGWIWDADPLQNFALLPSKAYLRREVIVWGDCVKLRYGSGPADNPWLWEYMTRYVTSLANIFDGFRIDNCHSTPLHVGVALLDAARVVNPNLYVCAELFTGSEEMDTHFVTRLGINSLIREAYNGFDPKEFSRLLYRFGVSTPIGSMDSACLTTPEELPPPTGKGPTRPCVVTPLQGSSPHAIFFDLTHDNETPLFKRSAEDALSTGALIAFTGSAIGSNKGFDDLYPKLLDLVNDNRRYGIEHEETKGIGNMKRALNHLHTEMVLDGFKEGHVHQENDYIAIHRVHPQTGQGYLLIAHTAFTKGSKERGQFNPTKLSRTTAHFLFGWSIDIPSYDVEHDDKTIRGLPSRLVDLPHVMPVEGIDSDGPFSSITVPTSFPPGSVLVFQTQIQGVDTKLDEFCKEGADEAMKNLDLVDLNVILHRANEEELDATGDEIGTFDIPGYGKLVYAGLEGWMAPLRLIMQYNQLGHPLCNHLRQGTWALTYVYSRLTKQVQTFPNLEQPASWLEARFERIAATVPSFLRPKYFAMVIYEAYKAARRSVIEQQTEFISTGHSFTHDLALCSVQMYGQIQSASLHPAKLTPSLAAGLPHFTTGWARCWGRDVFISLRGLFLTTGNFFAAKRHILAFASTLKHGLIPNLLDSLRNPRYNSRDSPWWMLQNIQDYAHFAPDGLSILSESVKRRFPKDDTFVPWDDPRAYAYSSTIAEIIQEILQRHADGISFREHNAGPNLDMQMCDEGFNVDIHVDWKTGLIFGGNNHNCGTWMDKMGESVKAGTKGRPGTPRDGAPVEVIGLLKSTLRWLNILSQKGIFPFNGVQANVNGQRRLVPYTEWNDLIQSSFEHTYYVPTDPAEDAKYVINSTIVNRRGIYKDVFGSGLDHEWSDYQLRPNFPIAMTVAPELFDPSHALGALKIAERVLLSPLGMKTLDPCDLQYRGYYDNSNDSTDGTIAKGMNYHNGPEWGWPLGYFLRAYLHFDTQTGANAQDPTETLHHLHAILLDLRKYIQNDPWRGLPELTNNNGAYCHDSCTTQAWSSSTILDFLHDVHQISTK